jgi:peptidoglycan/LPS O-acetylase OafA/YrhL
MGRAFSIYLDLVRFLAAVVVYLWHSNQRTLVEPLVPMGLYGPSAVIAFFVLSGFVIAYVVDTKEQDWRRFVAGRGARVFSVVVPVMILTLVLDGIGRSLHPGLYDYPFDQFVVRTVASLLMLNEVWFVSITAFSNVPYWSIAFETWYYVLFGLAMFVPGRWKWPAVIAAGLLVGPKVLMLLPIWLSGVLLYRWAWPKQRSFGFALCLVLISIAGIIGMHYCEFPKYYGSVFRSIVGDAMFREFTFAKYFLSDYILCFLVWLNFAGMRIVAPRIEGLLATFESPIRYLASLTFTLYLLHQPAMLFWAAVVRGDPAGWGPWWTFTALTALTVVIVSHFTEQRRYALRKVIERLLSGRQRQRGAVDVPAGAGDGTP